MRGRACVGYAFGTGGVATCVFADTGCIRQHWGHAYNDMCLDGAGPQDILVLP